MRRTGALAVVALALLAAPAGAQLVPLARCQAAFPCSVPYGLRPADAVANLPDARLGNSLVGVGVDSALKPRVLSWPISSDPVEDAARIYVKKNPLKAPRATPSPAPTPKASAPKDLQLP
jgi:hypothetical protein